MSLGCEDVERLIQCAPPKPGGTESFGLVEARRA